MSAPGPANVRERALAREGPGPLRRGPVRTLQVNATRRCNLACHHCHVEAGPKRTEDLSDACAERLLLLLDRSPEVETLDLTGGAPEMSRHFRRLVEGARRRGRRIIDRCNLTVLLAPGQEDTARFLAEQGVEIVASLPCYSAANVDAQRGRGVFEGSIEALRLLNGLGYGRRGSPLRLDLVYNPAGAELPPPQAELERRYHEELERLFGIEFHRLLALANLPIGRFARQLEREGRFEAYLSLLANHFNPATLPELMCRSLVSVDHDGRMYDCDFNQMLALEVPGRARTVFEVERLGELEGRAIRTGRHCLGCTAGSGSSCGGALTDGGA